MSKPFDKAIVIGRFQIFHNAHQHLLDEAFTKADHVIVVLGSHRSAPNIRNPFTTSERETMIRRVYPDRQMTFVVVQDHTYNDSLWLQEVQCKVKENLKDGEKACVCGYYKDYTSYYLDYFRELWAFEAHVNRMNISATDIRNLLFRPGDSSHDFHVGFNNIPKAVRAFLKHWTKDEKLRFRYLCDEYDFIIDYIADTQTAKYIVQFMTVDCIVVQNGHVLMVKRKGMPGKGLWAFPGGFVNPTESIENAALRELKEETSITVPKQTLRSKIKDRHYFDDPKRDLRGRIVTYGFFIKLDDNKPLPGVNHGSDADKAFWVPWYEIFNNCDKVFSDHVDILSYFLNRF